MPLAMRAALLIALGAAAAGAALWGRAGPREATVRAFDACFGRSVVCRSGGEARVVYGAAYAVADVERVNAAAASACRTGHVLLGSTRQVRPGKFETLIQCAHDNELYAFRVTVTYPFGGKLASLGLWPSSDASWVPCRSACAWARGEDVSGQD